MMISSDMIAAMIYMIYKYMLILLKLNTHGKHWEAVQMNNVCMMISSNFEIGHGND